MNFINNTPMGTQTQDDFIMLPTNDVCFAGLMENPKVRKGFCAAVMRVRPEEIAETELLPTHLHREYADDKLGILDVRVKLRSFLRKSRQRKISFIGCVSLAVRTERSFCIWHRLANT